MTKPVVIAFDPATTCGCAFGRIGGEPTLASVKLGDRRTSLPDLCGAAVRHVNTLIDNCNPVLFAVEEPFFKEGDSNYGTTVILHGLYGAITGAARARGVLVWPVAVSTWRAVALGTSKFGSRNSAKKAMMDLCAQLGWPAEDDNAADAGGIWTWATAKYAPYGVLPAKQSDIARL
jgi:hypothetical protein